MSDFHERYRAALDEGFEQLVANLPPVDEPGPHRLAFDNVTKSIAIPLTTEMAMEYGLIPDTRPKAHTPWRRRMRWRFSNLWWELRRRVGLWIAGIDDPEGWA